jgi:hypothetical protein
MKKAIITCNGFETEYLIVPQFTLMHGEVISLEWPLLLGHSASEVVLDILTGRQEHPAILISGSVEQVGLPQFFETTWGSVGLTRVAAKLTPTSIREKFRKTSNEKYAMKYWGKLTPVTEANVSKIRGFLSLNIHNSLAAINGHGLKIIGLKLGLERSDAVIFDTIFSNSTDMYEVLAQSMDSGKAALEIAYPRTEGPSPSRDVYPDATRLVVELKTAA